MPNRYFTPMEIAYLLGQSYRTVLRWIKDGSLYSAGKLNKENQIPADSLLYFLNTHKKLRRNFLELWKDEMYE